MFPRLPAFSCPMAVFVLLVVTYLGECTDAWHPIAAVQVDFGARPVVRIPPGTVVGQHNSNGWNRIVLFATPRLAAGAVDKIPAMARNYATRFNVVIMARVGVGKAQPSSSPYQLDQVGVGYCTKIKGHDIVISSDTQEQLGAELGAIERIVLGQNEKVLDDMVQIVRSRTITVFDVKALVLVDGKHYDMLVRHLVWVSPGTGKVATLVWPLAQNTQGQYHIASKSLVVVPGGFREDRIIHVSAEEITLGIPSARAFALAGMPPGKKIPVDARLAKLAAKKKYDQASMEQFLDAIKKVF